MHKLKIEMTAPGRGTVWLDGFKVEGTTAVQFNAETNDVSKVIIHVNVMDVEITGDVDAELVARVMGSTSFPKLPDPDKLTYSTTDTPADSERAA
jgi:hypothetical protein